MTAFLIGVSIAAFIGFATLLYYLRKETLSSGALSQQAKDLEATNEALSNRPVTDNDLLKLLRDKAASERKDLH